MGSWPLPIYHLKGCVQGRHCFNYSFWSQIRLSNDTLSSIKRKHIKTSDLTSAFCSRRHYSSAAWQSRSLDHTSFGRFVLVKSDEIWNNHVSIPYHQLMTVNALEWWSERRHLNHALKLDLRTALGFSPFRRCLGCILCIEKHVFAF